MILEITTKAGTTHVIECKGWELLADKKPVSTLDVVNVKVADVKPSTGTTE